MEIEDNRNEGRTKGRSAPMKKERKRYAHTHTDREEINASSGKRSHSDGRRRSEREKGRDIWRERRGRSEETP